MSTDNLPDWNKIAEKFDLWVPFIAPVGEKMIKLAAVKEGEKVLDVASGTGEPALSLVNSQPGKFDLIGTDAMEGMVKVAQSKVESLDLKRVEFKTMPAEQLAFDDNSFDKVICRFGVMLFQDSQQGLNEMCRVLKPGGKMVMAVWNTPETMPIMNWSFLVFQGKIDDEVLPAIPKLTSLSGVGVLDNMLEKAGFSQYEICTEDLTYEFESFDHYWELMEASEILKVQFDALPKDQHGKIRDEVEQFAQAFKSENGQLSVPHQYLLVHGSK